MPSILTACFVLHNIAIYLKDEEVLQIDEDLHLDDDNIEDHEELIGFEFRREGQVALNRFARIIYKHQNNL